MAALDSVFFLKGGERRNRGRQIKKLPVHVSFGFRLGHGHVLEDRQGPREPHWELQG